MYVQTNSSGTLAETRCFRGRGGNLSVKSNARISRRIPNTIMSSFHHETQKHKHKKLTVSCPTRVRLLLYEALLYVCDIRLHFPIDLLFPQHFVFKKRRRPTSSMLIKEGLHHLQVKYALPKASHSCLFGVSHILTLFQYHNNSSFVASITKFV